MDKYASTSTVHIHGRQGYEVRSGSGPGLGHGQGQGHLNWENYNLRGLNASIIVPFFSMA